MSPATLLQGHDTVVAAFVGLLGVLYTNWRTKSLRAEEAKAQAEKDAAKERSERDDRRLNEIEIAADKIPKTLLAVLDYLSRENARLKEEERRRLRKDRQ